MSVSPLISVILPTYNQSGFLLDALESIRFQNCRDFELIVVNDGSTDNTCQILQDFQKELAFSLITQENQGLPKALNTGFSHARGKFLTWTSSDNIMLPTMLEKLAANLENNPKIGVVYADWCFIDEAGKNLGDFPTLNYDRDLLLHHNYVHCCFLFRRICMEEVGWYDPEFIYGEDWEFWIRVSRKFQMKRVPEILYKYRLHSQSMTSEMLLEKTVRNKMGYLKFEAIMRRQSPIRWYIGKLKFKLLALRMGYDPRQKWKKTVNQSLPRKDA